jgi:hypothetical protein
VNKTRWVYGVTTVPARAGTLLPRTLKSLAAAGFDQPWLFIDGVTHTEADRFEREFKLPVTGRCPPLKAFGNWILALAELYIRQPVCNRYAIFQDDLVTYRNLRSYLCHCPFPEKGYWNLFTFPNNQLIAPRDGNGKQKIGWYESDQWGKGAVGLIFSREAVMTVLQAAHMIARPADASRRSTMNIDGGVVTAMTKAGWKEFVHNPSLIQHTGDVSTMDHGPHPKAAFRGEDFDAMELLNEAKRT